MVLNRTMAQGGAPSLTYKVFTFGDPEESSESLSVSIPEVGLLVGLPIQTFQHQNI